MFILGDASFSPQAGGYNSDQNLNRKKEKCLKLKTSQNTDTAASIYFLDVIVVFLTQLNTNCLIHLVSGLGCEAEN